MAVALTLDAGGHSAPDLVAASPFPRHWVYDHERRLIAKSGLVDFESWYHEELDAHTPWGDEHSAPVVALAETALERELSNRIMRSGAAPEIRRLEAGRVLIEQGEEGGELYLLLDGLLVVEVDGEPVAELGPGAVLGERAILEGGRRTATVRAMTGAKVAVASVEQLDRQQLADLSGGHRREERPDR